MNLQGFRFRRELLGASALTLAVAMASPLVAHAQAPVTTAPEAVAQPASPAASAVDTVVVSLAMSPT